jgi:hypothetical protein
MARPLSPLTLFIRSLPAGLPISEVIARVKAEGLESTNQNIDRIWKMSTSTAVQQTAVAKEVSGSTSPEAPAAPQTASDFIRQHPDLSTADVIAAGKAGGLNFTSSLVYAVRGKMAGKGKVKKATPRRATPSKAPVSKPVVTRAAIPSTPSKPEAAIPVDVTTPASSSSGLEELLRAIAAELGLGRAVEILAGERERVRGMIGG